MRVLQLRISGRWAQFRKPETNNNPLTHDLITKTALIGLMGAVLGTPRREMRPLFPILCDGLRYGARVNGVVKKESWGFTLRSATSYGPNFLKREITDRAPKQMEFLRDPDFTITLALHDSENETASKYLHDFAQAVREEEAHFTPVLGLHNCPAELIYIGESEGESATGDYMTSGFVRRDQPISWEPGLGGLRVGYEKLPSFQNDDWWNLPDRYVPVAYPSDGAVLKASGEHIKLSNGGSWCLI
jgi:CRISPR-associated protein Cas5 subtype I-B